MNYTCATIFISKMGKSLLSFICFSYPGTVLKVKASIRMFLFRFNILESGLITVIEHDLLVHKVFEIFFAKTVLFEIKIKSADWFCLWFIIWEM